MRTPEIHVARDGTRTWRIRFRMDGKQTTETFVRERDARTFAGWLDKLGASEAVQLLHKNQKAAGERTVREWCAEYVDGLVGVTDGTIAGYRAYIRRDLDMLGDLPISALTSKAVAEWVKAMADTGAAEKTMTNKHSFLSACMKGAAAAGLIPVNPCKGTRIPRTVSRPMVILTSDEYTRFLGCFPNRWLPLVETLFGTGMRWGEASALQVGDVDLSARRIMITRAWKHGTNGAVLGPPKSRRSRRTITIPPEIAAALAPLVDGRPGDAFVFTTGQGGHVRGPYFHERVWQPAVKLANGEVPTRSRGKGRTGPHEMAAIPPLDPPLGKRPRIHDARHTFASWALGNGVSVYVVQRHMGHESIKTTADTYADLLPSDADAMSGAMSAALSASRPQLLP